MTDMQSGGAAFVAFANQKGGVGKTSLAVGVAAAAGRAHTRTLGVDTDPQGSMEDIAGAMGNRIGFDFSANRDPRALQQLRKVLGLYDLVVVDTAGSLDEILGLVVTGADLVVIPCVPERAFIRPTLATAAFCAERGADYRILISMDDPVKHGGPADSLRRLLEGSGQPVMQSTVRRYAAWPQAQLEGIPITDYTGTRTARQARADLAAVHGELMSILFRKARA
jgi:chromosome partitioning protein